MTRTSNDSDADQLLESRIVAIDEAIAVGKSLAGSGDPRRTGAVAGGETAFDPIPPAPAIAGRVEGLKQCLLLLETARQEGTLAGLLTAADHRDVLDTIDRIGRFEIIREIGRGGYGVVLLAFDPQLTRHVALKVPRPESLLITGLRERFMREARAAAALAHPNIVRVYETGEDGPLCYLAAEFCAGPTLAQWLSRRGRAAPVRDAVQLVATLADAVDQAHQRGVIHRDIKPSNVLLDPGGTPLAADCEHERELSDFVPKLTDFGLARLLDEATSETRSGAMLGTPRYMSPEQIEGRREDVGPQTDVFALGVILYELLAGQPPFEGTNQLDILRKITSHEPLSLHATRRDIPLDLEAVVLCCLERSPQRRYDSAQALAADLRRFLRGEPTLARPLSTAGRLAKFVRRRPAVAALFCLLVFAPLAVIAAVSIKNVELSEALETAKRNETEANLSREATDRERAKLAEQVYPIDMKMAYEAYQGGNVIQAEEILSRYLPGTGREHLRGFEWHYFRRICHPQGLELRGHTKEVYFATFSPDGKRLATGSGDGTVRLWDAESGECAATLIGHTNDVNWVSYSPDGKLLASASDDNTVRVWDVASQRTVHTFHDINAHVVAVQFSPDGKLLATADRGGMLRLWTYGTWELADQRQAHRGRIECLAFSPDGSRIATCCGEDGSTKVWHVIPLELDPVHQPPGPWDVRAVAFLGSSTNLVRGGNDGLIRFTEMSESRSADLMAHRTSVESVSVSPKGNRVAAGGSDDRINVVYPQLGLVVGTIQRREHRVWCVTFSRDGKRLASTSGDRTATIWDPSRDLDRAYRTFPFPQEPIALSPYGRFAAVCVADTLVVWAMPAEREVARFNVTPVEGWRAIELSPDGKSVAVGGPDNTVEIWDVSTQKRVKVLRGLVAPAEQFRFTLDGRSLIALSQKHHPVQSKIVYWKLNADQQRPAVTLHTGAIHNIAVLGDGASIAYPHSGGLAVHSASVANGEMPEILVGPKLGIGNLCAAANGKRIAGVSDSGNVRVWDLETQEQANVFSGRFRGGTPIALSPDATTLATGDGGKVQLWHVATGQLMCELEAVKGGIHHVAFAPDGSALFALGKAHGLLWEYCRWDTSQPRDGN